MERKQFSKRRRSKGIDKNLRGILTLYIDYDINKKTTFARNYSINLSEKEMLELNAMIDVIRGKIEDFNKSLT